MKHLLYLFFFSSFIFSCNSLEKKETFLEQEIRRLHDIETMPKVTGVIPKLIKEIVNNVDSTTATTLINDLNQSDEMMMDWMVGFKWQKDIEPIPPIEKRISYYEKEVEKLEALKIQINTSIKNAEKGLKK